MKYVTIRIVVKGSPGIAGLRWQIGGVGRAFSAPHHHIFPYIKTIPIEPVKEYSYACG
jgi:hypothetical protein